MRWKLCRSPCSRDANRICWEFGIVVGFARCEMDGRDAKRMGAMQMQMGIVHTHMYSAVLGF